ncbi:MAG: response regulator [Leptolyngbyaceae cyanobacterium CSU_1_3]|nr:response regulator [Leptolyngbyaceae cyanobacterium CSU_1_3]
MHLEIDRAPNVPRFIQADQTKLRQVLINLLSNAVKFTDRGSIVVTIERGTLPSPVPLLSFTIADTGQGIAPAELATLFEAFVQTATGKSTHEGTGLGLSISQKFVQLMGGKITVHSEVGHGSRFAFQIPVGVVEAAQVKPKQPSRRVVALEPNQPIHRILVVDDGAVNRLLLVKLLAPLGFEIKEASDGQSAIDLCQQWEPHLIWMDMRMPVMDGYEATKQIKSTTKGQAIAIIALTASVLEEERTVILSVGCDDFVRKPFREAEIFAAMQRHLGVQYVYADREDFDPIAAVPARELLTVETLRSLPPDWVSDLRQALTTVDLDLATQTIAQIQSQSPALAIVIQQCIDNFEYEQVLAVLP